MNLMWPYYGSGPSPFERDAERFRLKKTFSAFRQGCRQNASDRQMMRAAFEHWVFRPGGVGMRRARIDFDTC